MSARNLLILLAILAAVAGIYYLRIGLGWESDLRSRPWAYSRDPGAKLLVGPWTGRFRDPRGVEKTIEITIDEPVTQKQREDRAVRRRKQSIGSLQRNKQAFHGAATITSQLGREVYGVTGSVDAGDIHRLQFRFISEDESRRIYPNLTAHETAQGEWRDDDMSFVLRFQQHQADGSTESSSTGTVVDGMLVWADESPAPEVPVRLKRGSTP
jgi:hypothetical protein